MKQFLLSILALSLFLTSFSQESSYPSSVTVKWAPASIYFGKISLGGEYNFSKKQSVTLGVGIPFDKTIRQDLDGEEESLTHKTFSILAGYRLYLGKKAARGLYFEPYLKYLKHDLHSQIDHELDGDNREFNVNSEFSAFGLGLQLGYQFLIADKFSIDFYFLGPEGNIAKSNTFTQEVGNGPAWSQSEVDDAQDMLNDFFEDIPFLRDEIEINVNASQRSVSTKFDGFLPGFRFGISLGFRF